MKKLVTSLMTLALCGSLLVSCGDSEWERERNAAIQEIQAIDSELYALDRESKDVYVDSFNGGWQMGAADNLGEAIGGLAQIVGSVSRVDDIEKRARELLQRREYLVEKYNLE